MGITRVTPGDHNTQMEARSSSKTEQAPCFGDYNMGITRVTPGDHNTQMEARSSSKTEQVPCFGDYNTCMRIKYPIMKKLMRACFFLSC